LDPPGAGGADRPDCDTELLPLRSWITPGVRPVVSAFLLFSVPIAIGALVADLCGRELSHHSMLLPEGKENNSENYGPL
jgi:hypothetical protein